MVTRSFKVPICEIIINYCKLLMSATFTLHRIFYCIAHSWPWSAANRDLLLLGRLLWLWMNLRCMQCKLCLSWDALIKRFTVIDYTTDFDCTTQPLNHTLTCLYFFWKKLQVSCQPCGEFSAWYSLFTIRWNMTLNHCCTQRSYINTTFVIMGNSSSCTVTHSN